MAEPRRVFDEGQRSRRRDARRRIMDAAAELLEERPWHDIALEEIMAHAALTRTAFYRHFDERSDLLLALLERSGLGEDPAGALWKGEQDDPVASLDTALRTLTDLFVEHGRLLRAASEAAAQVDEVREVYAQFAEGFIVTTAERIEADRAAGRSMVADTREVARALVWMNERYLLSCFGERPFTTEPEVAAAALTEVWTATVYGERPARTPRDLPFV